MIWSLLKIIHRSNKVLNPSAALALKNTVLTDKRLPFPAVGLTDQNYWGKFRYTAPEFEDLPWLKTCQRQVSIFPQTATISIDLQPTDQLLEGIEAYRFFLELSCGLHSKLAGETEIGGQVKEFFENLQKGAHPFGYFYSKLYKQLQEDVKYIRYNYLRDIGILSYGHIVQRKTGDADPICILGFGKLAKEMLPWLQCENRPIEVVIRNEARVREIPKPVKYRLLETTQSCLNSESNSSRGAILIVAAGMSNVELTSWIKQQKIDFFKIVDLRGEDELDLNLLALKALDDYISLKDIFIEQEQYKFIRNEKIVKAFQATKELCDQKGQAVVHSPSGWEDVCA